ncbi:hypothetical protein [Shewanella oncorhynchi]|uniref:hypothetical protein n=1 Tax=Shewanella oncorhynchi TaxID=2726434 RepID=UPI003D791D27
MSNINLLNVTLNSQQIKTTSEKDALQFESELKAAGEVHLSEQFSDSQVKVHASKQNDYVTEEEFKMKIVEQAIINQSIRQMKVSQERMKEILDEV